jgi:hypothetical protein
MNEKQTFINKVLNPIKVVSLRCKNKLHQISEDNKDVFNYIYGNWVAFLLDGIMLTFAAMLFVKVGWLFPISIACLKWQVMAIIDHYKKVKQ